MTALKTPQEVFDLSMTDPAWRDWYMARPERIKEMVKLYPYEKYRMKPDAPYGVICPGTTVYLLSYSEDGYVRVRVRPDDLLPEAVEHILDLCKTHNKSIESIFHPQEAFVNPNFLEPIE